MKKLLLLIPVFFFFLFTVNATDYYIAANGNDNNNGTSQSSPWKSIGKLNAYFSNLHPGDRVLFRRGDVFYGSIKVNKSGTAGSPITIGAYGSGTKPVISGFTTINSWNNLGGNIWESRDAVSSLPYSNMVVADGENQPMGRWPNTGYLTYDSHSGNTSITSKQLSSSPVNWEGAEIAVFITTYAIGRNKILSHSGNTINFVANPRDGNIQKDNQGFFIQNDIRTLDIKNEWFYNPSNKKLSIYTTGTPSNVKISTIENLVILENNNSIVFDDLEFEGANSYGFYMGNAKNIEIKNCSVNFSGIDGLYGFYSGKSSGIKIKNCDIINTNSTAINLSKDFEMAHISSNRILNSGNVPGMSSDDGGNGSGASGGIYASGPGSTIEYNDIRNVGYKGIHFFGSNTKVANNYIDGYCVVKRDGGGIYCFNGGNKSDAFINIQILNNVILNGEIGIYLDSRLNNVLIKGNTTANGRIGIFVVDSWLIKVESNTAYNNSLAAFEVYKYKNDVPNHSVNVLNNIFFAKTLSQRAAYFEPLELVKIGNISNYNYYAKPIDIDKAIDVKLNGVYGYKTLAQYQAITSQDLNSMLAPKKISDTNDLRFEYNSGIYPKTVILNANYIDVKNTSYNGSITLAPYTSVVLIRNGEIQNQNPISNAGQDQIITLPVNSVNLKGSGQDSDGTIVSYEWSKKAGPGFGKIVSPNSANTSITDLVEGVYQFELKVTDNDGGAGLSIVTVTVKKAETGNPLVVNAGANAIIQLPLNSVTLNGTASVSGGTIVSYKWSQVSGPEGALFANANSEKTVLSKLVSGTYVLELKATDDKGNSGISSLQIIVNGDDNLLPAINPEGSIVNGISFKYYEAPTFGIVPDFSLLKEKKSGVLSNFNISEASRAEVFAFNYYGYIDIPSDGFYTFYTNSDDGSVLYIDDQLVVDNDGLHGSRERSGVIGLEKGIHKIVVNYFQETGGKNLDVYFSGPGISKQTIPSDKLFHLSDDNLLPAVNPSNVVKGLDYKYFEANSFGVLPDFQTSIPLKSGSTWDFNINNANRNEIFAFEFKGFIEVPSDGEYIFYTNSDDGSNLIIDGILVVNNDGLHGAREKLGKIGLKKGKHSISVGYFQETGQKNLTVSYAGPGILKQSIPGNVLFRLSDNSLLPSTDVSNPELGLDFRYFEAGSYGVLPNFLSSNPVKSGVSSGFDISHANRAEVFAFEFTGFVQIPSDGQYTFYTSSDDGSALYIDGIKVVDNDGLHGNRERSGTIGLKAGMHSIILGYFQETGGKNLIVSYSGPGLSKRVIPNSSLFRGSVFSKMGSNNFGEAFLSTKSTMKSESILPAMVIKAYPNPFKNNINISLDREAGHYTIQIIDLFGRVVLSRKGSKGEGFYQQSINTNLFQKGFYFIRIEHNNQLKTIKIEKL